MRSPVQVWSAAPLKNTTKTSCFFNAFLTHLRDLFLNRAWSLSSALDDFSCKQSLIFACRQQLIKYRLFTTKTSCFLMCAKFFAHICTISLKLCVEPVVYARCLFLQAIPHLRLPSKLSRQTSRRYGVPFLCASRTPLQKLCRRVRRRRSRLPLASNFSLFSCRQQLYGLFCHRSLSVAVLFVLIFQLYNIVDYLLIHRPYGFIVQFLMINTGNGGSFVQL